MTLTIANAQTTYRVKENTTPITTFEVLIDDIPFTSAMGSLSFRITTPGVSDISLNGSTGLLRYIAPLDYENENHPKSITFDMEVNFQPSDNSLQTTEMFTITVQLEDAGPVINSGATAMDTAMAIVENNDADIIGVYTATTSTAEAVTWSIEDGGDSQYFTIDDDGEVTFNGSANYEDKPTYSFTVIATDSAGERASQEVTLSVTNVDEAPKLTLLGSYAVYENTENATVALFEWSDPDGSLTENDITLSLSGASGFEIRAVTPTIGEIVLSAGNTLDAEHLPGDLTLIVTTNSTIDGVRQDNLVDTITIPIKVRDTLENGEEASIQLDEATAGTTLGKVNFAGTGTYSVTDADGETSTNFIVNGEGFLAIKSGASISAGSYELTLTHGTGDDQQTATITVEVNDVMAREKSPWLDPTGTINLVDQAHIGEYELDINGTDIEADATKVMTSYGWMTVDMDGTWSYKLDDLNPAVHGLRGDGSNLVETVTVTLTRDDDELTDIDESETLTHSFNIRIDGLTSYYLGNNKTILNKHDLSDDLFLHGNSARINELTGGSGDDVLEGTSYISRLHGGDGDDALRASSGITTFYGGDGNDRLDGSARDGDSKGYVIYNWTQTARSSDAAIHLDMNDATKWKQIEQGRWESGTGEGYDFIRAWIDLDTDNDDPQADEYDYLRGVDKLSITTTSAGSEISGGDGNDRLTGGSGNDIFSGNGGRDTLRGNDGNDVLDGGDGRDYLFGNDGDDMLDGGSEADYLSGGDDNDALNGGAGNDYLYGNDGSDMLDGGEGNDMLFGNDGNDVLDGGEGNDTLYGSDGNDVLDGESGTDTLAGGAGNDIFVLNLDGTANDIDTVYDFSSSANNNDKIRVDIGNSTVTTLAGLKDAANIRWTNDSNHNTASRSNDSRTNDTVIYDTQDTESTADDVILMVLEDFTAPLTLEHFITSDIDITGSFTAREDSPWLNPAGTIDFAIREFSDYIATATTSNNYGTVTIDADGAWSYKVDNTDDGAVDALNSGGTLTDTVTVTLTSIGGFETFTRSFDIIIDGLTDDTLADGATTLDYRTSDDNLSLHDNTDSTGENILYGGNGDDVLHGHSNQVSLYGRDGDDTLIAGSGNTKLYGGAGNDVFDGREGTAAYYSLGLAAGAFHLDMKDTVKWQQDNQGVWTSGTGEGYDYIRAWIDLDGDTEDTQADEFDYLLDIDSLYIITTSSGSEISGGDGNDELEGNVGNDIFSGGGGNDELEGNGGNDVLDGGTGNDRLDGGSGNDVLDGGSGDDRLSGGSDNDVLDGGAGRDALNGGSGDDIFVLNLDGTANDIDTVYDFSASDKIRVDIGDNTVTTLAELKSAANIRWINSTTHSGSSVYDTIIYNTRGTADTNDDIVLMMLEGFGTPLTLAHFDIQIIRPVITSSTTAHLDEGNAAGIEVYTAQTYSTREAVTWSIADGDDPSNTKINKDFSIDSANGVVTLNESADYEIKSSYSFIITATNDAGSATQTVTLSIVDMVETPVFTSGDTVSISENNNIGAVVYTTAVSGSPEGTAVTYALSGDDSNAFSIDTNGVVTFTESADYETKPTYSFIITAANDAGSATQTVTLSIVDKVEAPVFTSGDSASISENNNVGAVVYRAAVSGSPEGTPVTYALTGDDSNAFSIDTHGVVTLNESADYESQSSYGFIITATNSAGSATQTVTLSIVDMVETPVFTSGGTASISENNNVGAVVYTTAVSGSPEGTPVTYALSGDDFTAFSIDTHGVVTLNESADYESQSSYGFTITATNDAGSATQTVTLSIVDMVETPVFTSGDSASISEDNNIGAVVYRTTVSGSPEGTPITYALTGDDFTAFSIDTHGVVTLNESADYDTKSSYSFIIMATNSVGSATQQVSIAVTRDIDVTGTFTAREDSPWFNPDGTITLTDDRTLSEYTATATASYGTVTVAANGAWSYDLNDEHANVEALNSGDTLTDTVTITLASDDETLIRNFVITIDGLTDYYLTGTQITLDKNGETDDLSLHGNSTRGSTLTGGSGDDVLNGLGNYSYLYGGAGDDWLIDGYHLYGGSGNDVYTNPYSRSNVYLESVGNIDVDMTSAEKWKYDKANDRWVSGTDNGYEYIRAWIDTDGDGLLELDDEFDFIHQGFRDIWGGSGNDKIIVGATDSTIYGNDGNDWLEIKKSGFIYGGEGDDVLIAGTGWSYLEGGVGNDIFDGRASSDAVYNSWYGSGDAIHLDMNDNVKWKQDAEGTWTSGTSEDFTYVRAWIDTDNDGELELDTDEFDYLLGIHRLWIRAASGHNEISGGDGRDSLSGGNGNDVLDGGAGRDGLSGGVGYDVLNGGSGGDTLWGGYGNDVLDGGTGEDRLSGHHGNDIFVLNLSGTTNDVDRVEDFSFGTVSGWSLYNSTTAGGNDKIRVDTVNGNETTLKALQSAANIRWTNTTNHSEHDDNDRNDSDIYDTIIYNTLGTADIGDDIELMVLQDYAEDLTLAHFDIV